MALIGIAQRIGREALLAEMEKFEKSAPPASSPEQREALADRILSYPRSSLEEYFQLFYRGLTPKDVTRALSRA